MRLATHRHAYDRISVLSVRLRLHHVRRPQKIVGRYLAEAGRAGLAVRARGPAENVEARRAAPPLPHFYGFQWRWQASNLGVNAARSTTRLCFRSSRPALDMEEALRSNSLRDQAPE